MDKTLRAKKSFGQHFLVDPAYCRKIVDFAGICSDDLVIEIGPGTGRLTQVLLGRATQVIGIEVDPDMVAVLTERFGPGSELAGRFDLIHKDVLEIDWPGQLDTITRTEPLGGEPLTSERIKFVGNLPYNISTRILASMTTATDRFHSFTFMSQKEVAERVLATPGTKDYGYLTLLMEYHFNRIKGFDVPPGAFSPPPKVMSHVMTLVPRDLPADWAATDYSQLIRLIKSSFSQRRKTLANNLKSVVGDRVRLDRALDEAHIDPRRRAESLSLEDFIILARVLS